MRRRDFLAAVACGGLIAGALVDAASLLAADKPSVIRGRVAGEDKPLAGVLVSDGCRVTRTNAGGEYELPTGADSGRFVFVSTPRGYWTDAFYVPIETATRTGRADFELKPIDQPDRFDFVFMADMHIGGNRPWGIGKCKASLREINALEPTPAFILGQGDICLQSNVGKEYVECLGLCKMPVRNAPGNHEMMTAHENPRDDFERLFGPTYHSFDWGGIHFIMLDGNKVLSGPNGKRLIHGAVEGSEMTWLEADLAAQPEGKPIVVGVHIPIISTYRQRRTDNIKEGAFWEEPNDRVLTELFAKHRVRMVLQGHMHENERITVGGVEYVESISLSGSWYKSGEGFERGVDGCPRGYRIVSVDGTKITHRYRSSCESRVDRQGEFSGLKGRVPSGKEVPIILNCYDAPNGSTAQARIDGGPWQPMPAYAAVNGVLTMPHHFRLLGDTTALGPGGHAVEARVTWPDGTVVVEEETFETGKVTITEQDDRIRVLLGGELFAEYLMRGYSRPLVYPIVGPYGFGMTRNFPMKKDVPGESHDHPHQKSMFFGFGSVNGVNFFAESRDSGKIVHDKLLKITDGGGRGCIGTSNKWVTADGGIVCTDTRRLTFHTVHGVRAIDWEITIHASSGDVKFKDDKHGSMAIRTHPNLQLDNAPDQGVTTANGQAINSEGVSGKSVFGKRAKWIDYWGKIDGKTVGIAIFDHPSNPRHPTWWMARGYGYIAADPFGGHAIGGEPPGTGDMTIKSGNQVTFHYRYLFHEGDPKQARIAEQYSRYAETVAAE